ncbi:oligosaccharide flippase family protein [Metabacillus niabensis]|uniref:oligosaccharide flippase family protein n=1 Tax=Metabacillus niabensis TaxID=324854 RepID=UPI0039A2443D
MINRILKKLFKKQAFLLIITLLTIRGFEFLTRAYIANKLGPEVNGQIQLFDTYINLIILFAIFGMNTSVLKFVSESNIRSTQKVIFNKIISLTLIFSFGISITLYLLSYVIPYDKWLIGSLRLMLLVIPLFSLTYFSQGIIVHYLLARELVNFSSIYKLILGSFFSLFLLIGALSYGFKGYYLSYFIYGAISSLIIIIFLIKKEEIKLNEVYNFIKKPKSLFREKYFSFAIPSFASNATSLIISNLDVLVISYVLRDTVSVGIFSAAVLVSRGVLIIPMGYMQAQFAKINKQLINDRNHIFKIYYKQFKKMSVLMLPISLVIIISSEFIIKYAFGLEYMDASLILKLLIISTLIQSIGMIGGNILLALGNVKANLILNLLRGIIGLFLLLYFTNILGLKGSAIANILGALLFLISQIIFLVYIQKINNRKIV